MRYLAIALLSLLVAVPSFAASAEDEAAGEVWKAFDEIVNHYKCYAVQLLLSTHWPPQVSLSDQFKTSEAHVLRPRYLCNPTKKNDTGIVNEEIHYVCFDIVQDFEPVLPDVRTSNQFGTQILRPIQSELLCLPTKKEHI